MLRRALNVFQRLPTVDTQRLRYFPCSLVCRSNSSLVSDIDFANMKLQKYLESLRQEFYGLRVNSTGPSAFARMNQLNGIVNALEQHRTIKGNMASKADIENETDLDMRQLIEEENEIYTGLLQKKEEELLNHMLLLTDNEWYPSLIFEINAGAGGQEAMLFAKDLFEMYTNYFDNNNWAYEVIDQDSTDLGGLRHAAIIVEDPEAYNYLRHEAGVHRVQRVPSTEKSGRVHTSTASVAVIPRPADLNVTIADKDLKIETKRASGAGGQHVNTTDSAVRVVHLPTGIAVENQTERSQIKNREIAIKRIQSKILQQQLQTVEASKQATRKSQQGNLDRNEKIRTYNFDQDRITDHRLQGGTMHNLERFLEGGEPLDILIERLVAEHRKIKLLEMVANWKDTETDLAVDRAKETLK